MGCFFHAQKRGKKKDKDNSSESSGAPKTEKLKAIQENRIPQPLKQKSLPPPRALRSSSLQPNMGNVLKDLKRATSSKYTSLNKAGPPPPAGGQPPKVTHRYPDDELSPGNSEEQSSPQNTGTLTPSQMQKKQQHHHQQKLHRQPITAAQSPSHYDAPDVDARAKARAAVGGEAEEARAAAAAALTHSWQQQEEAKAREAAQLAAEAEEDRKHLAREAAAAEEAARASMQEKRLAEEAAAAEVEAARIVMREKQEAEAAAAAEAEAAAMEAAQRQQRQTEMAICSRPHESAEANGPGGSGHVDPTDPPKNPSPARPANSPTRTRRDIMSARRERARNRHFSGKMPTSSREDSSTVSAAVSVPNPPVPCKVEPKQEVLAVEVSHDKPCQSSSLPAASTSSKANARASARSRYVRHKKMLHQRAN